MRESLWFGLYVFILGFEAAYLLSELVPVPVWWYFPLEHRWEWLSSPGSGLGMGWYGKVLLCLGVGGSLGGMAYGWMAWWRRPIPHEWFGLLDASVISLTLFDLYFMVKTLVGRTF